MPLAAGMRLGPYEIAAPIGAGGMGEVYRARDAKLARDVAIKILPDHFAADPERRGRFEREARTLASLNHQHIAHIYGFEENGAELALVMELVEGPTLAERLANGPLPIDDAIAIARQMADGLEAAHEQGIVHRDLKPANIKVRDDGTVKILDFGLAKALDPAVSSSAAAMNSPTLTAHATVAGVILGTAAYMSPEQARGKTVDRRADIWAFGAILYEMLTGRRAFEGTEISDTLASVLKQDPDWTALPRELATPIRRLLRRSLEKDPRQRLSAIGDARLELNEGERIETAPSLRSQRRIWLAALGAAAILAAAATTWVAASWPRATPPAPVTRFSILPAENTTLFDDSTSAAISADGRMIVLVTGNAGSASNHFTGLWLRSTDSPIVRPLAGTERGFLPFWSPDGRQIAFFTTDHKLKTITVATGQIDEVGEAPEGRGGTWNREGVIVFAPATSGPLMKVMAAGGTPEPVTNLDAARGETGHRFPSFLPDGDHFLFAAVPPRAGGFDMFVGSLKDGGRAPLLSAQSVPVYAEPGYLLFMRRGALAAQRFDPSRRVLSGEPESISDAPGDVGNAFMAGPAVSASTTGVLAYLADLPGNPTLLWLSQSGGQSTKINIPAGRYSNLSLAGDSRRAVLVRLTSPTSNDLWIADLARGGVSRLTEGSNNYINVAIWSPDGERVAFSSNRQGPRDIYVKSVGTAAEEPLYQSKALAKDPTSWSSDGEFLVYRELSPETNWDLWVLSLRGNRGPTLYAQTSFNESDGAISPEGRAMAYTSDETGRSEIYVQSFPTPGRKYRVTTDGATQAWWRRDGKQLLIVNVERTKVLLADVQAGTDFSTSPPRVVGSLPKGIIAIDATPDLQRLILLVNEGRDADGSVTIVENWTAALR